MSPAPEARFFRRHPVLALVILNLVTLLLLDQAMRPFVDARRRDRFRRPDPVYHHGLKPLQSSRHRWGPLEYPVFTNSLGFKDRAPRTVPPRATSRRILFIGDSFTEGIGVRFEETFVGRVAAALSTPGPRRAEVLNAGVIGYSPHLYYLKVRHLMESVGLRFDELWVFVDLSDPINELEYADYRPAGGRWRLGILTFDGLLLDHSALYYLIRRACVGQGGKRLREELDGEHPCWAGPRAEIHDPEVESRWTRDPDLFRRFAAEGLKLGARHMSLLISLCRARGVKVTIAVYPWPTQVLAGEKDGIQSVFWRDFAAREGVGFLDLFPTFINGETPETVVARDYIPGDDHWNREGHRRVAEAVLDRLSTPE